MRTTQYLLATLKESPANAELMSHQLMLRAGMIRKLASGLYSWLPSGFKVLHKVVNVVREEMNRAGAIEISMPAVQPAELWQETGRWDQFGSELLKLRDRHERDFCFGPTHEEVITDFMRRDIRSYKQLPITLYQIQTKFRDEIRPRFGVMRAREFLMKDAYSFHLDSDSLEKTYEIMRDAYCRIFKRLGLTFRVVLADTGSIGGKASHEFQVLADAGEDKIFFSDTSDYAANVELAAAKLPDGKPPAPSSEKMAKVETPSKQTINDVCEHLHISPAQTVKTLIVQGTEENQLVALVLRGDHELNPTKAEKHPAISSPLTLATDKQIQTSIGCRPGFIGPIGLDIPIIVDHSAALLADFVCGANENDAHYQHVNWARNLPSPTPNELFDLRNVVVGDPSPDGKGTLKMARGIEVGHIFQLGDKYSRNMAATVLNEKGKAIPLQMGCYGIGISRIVAAAIEQHHDDHGIVWPVSMAPFDIALIPINLHKSVRLQQSSQVLYEELLAAGFDVLYDDRKERVGVLFADMELIGIPYQVILSDSCLDDETVEFKRRGDTEKQFIKRDNIVAFLKELKEKD